jgi:hypothetical protein
MARRYVYEDEDMMDEYEDDELDEGYDDEDEDEDEDDELDEGDEYDDEEMEESHHAHATLVEQNERLLHANNRSARYMVAFSSLVNSSLNEAQQIDLIARLDNPYNYTIQEWQEYVSEAVDAFERGDRRAGVFESRKHTTSRATGLQESYTPSNTGDTTYDATINVLRRMRAGR